MAFKQERKKTLQRLIAKLIQKYSYLCWRENLEMVLKNTYTGKYTVYLVGECNSAQQPAHRLVTRERGGIIFPYLENKDKGS